MTPPAAAGPGDAIIDDDGEVMDTVPGGVLNLRGGGGDEEDGIDVKFIINSIVKINRKCEL